MDYRESIVHLTRLAAEHFLRTAYSVPSDKRYWRPLDAGRSVHDQAAECAVTPLEFAQFITDGVRIGTPSFAPEDAAPTDSFPPLEELEPVLRENLETFCSAVMSLSEAQLDEEVEPDEGWRTTYRYIILMPMRNFYHHVGQIDYIQTLYGDYQMH